MIHDTNTITVGYVLIIASCYNAATLYSHRTELWVYNKCTYLV